ncbi:phytoene desaturase family protein [Govanella unica]|uniref:Pyridine nucleotide-disulfide oxidoreductase domain-containing protein 2 n=1 Tax=Govanella unica TaxID=2975056 RepID=A0A9X3TY71_9PROT|nr:NAD(P)/FAD-dependent oxidoreductase [Govania unica]MDA5193870.1 NAD(P)/FAD-dependent oxidoreductase [Govania unica]
MTVDADVIIIGGGHNGLACCAQLTKAGLSVILVERNSWLGGATGTKEVTLPGFRHDLYGSSHVWIHANPYFREILPELEEHGLEYIWSKDLVTGHPTKTGPGIVVYKDVDKTCASIAQYSEADAKRYREIYDGFVEIKDGFIKGMFSPPSPPSYLPAVMENSRAGLRMLRDYNLSARAFVEENFEHPEVRNVILGWALAPQITPDQEAVGQTFYIMIPGVHEYGQAIPKGGSQMLAEALANYSRAHGAKIMTDAGIEQILVTDGTATGVRLSDGRELHASKAVVSSLDPRQTFLKLIDSDCLDPSVITMAKAFSYGNIGVFRSHYALNEAPRFKNGDEMSQTTFQRIFYSVEDTRAHYADIALGVPPRNPFIWTACWTLQDPSRAPEGKHTLIIDTFVPHTLASGESWDDAKHDFAALILSKLREYTDNMGPENILGEYVDTPLSIERANACLVGGTSTGGERTLSQTGYFRPMPGYSQYRGPLKNFYLTGASCHPGGGITAMGMVTANEMLEDFGI